MEVSYVMNVEDFRAWNRYVMSGREYGSCYRTMRNFLGGFLVLVWFVALLPLILGQGLSAVRLPLVIPNAIFTLLWLFWNRFVIWLIVRTQSPADRAKMASVHTISITPEALSYSSRHSSDKVG